MPSTSKQKPKVGAYVATKTEGVYKRTTTTGFTWHIRYTDQNGKRVWSACESFEHAKARLGDATVKKSKGEVLANPGTTLSDLLPGWRAERDVSVKPRTRETEDRNIRLYIDKRWGREKVRDIGRASLSTWINGLKKQDGEPMNSGTRALVLSQLSSILNFAVDEGIIGSNPVRAITGKSKPVQGTKVARLLGVGELDALVAGVGRQTWLAPIIRFTAFTGLRLSEVCGLRWGDVSFEDGTITVERQWGKGGKFGTTKSGKERTIPMLWNVADILRTQHAEVARQRLLLGLGTIRPETPVFTNSTGGHRGPKDVQRGFVWARDRAGLSEEPRALCFHDLRHSVATALANEPGAVLPQVMAFLGHANIATTMLYVHGTPNPAWKKSAGAALSALGS